MEVQFLPSGDMGITVEFGKEISLEINTKVRMLHHDLKEHPIDGVIETIPTYSALLVIDRPDVLLFDALVEILRERIEHMQGGVEKMKTSVTEIPVLYGGKWGMDLADCAKMEHISEKEFIKIHSGSEYYVYMLGFAPGHPYAARFENPFHFKRRESPRLKVPGSSIVAGENLSNILPFDQPCGWNLIGATPLKMCDYSKKDPFLLHAGQWIKFVPINETEYWKIKEDVEKGQYQCRTYEKEE